MGVVLDIVAVAVVLCLLVLFFLWFVIQVVETGMKIVSPDPWERREGWREAVGFTIIMLIILFIEWRL